MTDVPEEEVFEQQAMKRLGYLEIRYRRDNKGEVDDIVNESWWGWVQPV